jgi:23S rRNA (guanosine2251-2'-O)-methyltransferase
MMQNSDFIFGIRAVIEAIESGREIDKVLIKRGLKSDLYSELIEKIRLLNITFQYVPVEKIERITRKNHQGVIAYISPIVYHNIEEIIPSLYESGKQPLILILDKITDIRNFGAIARTAECAGVDAIIIPETGSAQINEDAIKTSAGALHVINVCRSKNLQKTIQYLKNSGLKIIAATEKADHTYFSADFTGPIAIIMGSEDRGIALEYLKNADELVRIPIVGKIESLNVSVASAVLIYEAYRQRNSI